MKRSVRARAAWAEAGRASCVPMAAMVAVASNERRCMSRSPKAGKGGAAHDRATARQGARTRGRTGGTVPYTGPNRIRFHGSRVKPASQPPDEAPQGVRDQIGRNPAPRQGWRVVRSPGMLRVAP
ncbi:hypothetical protein GCM10011320_23180 [Neoroseomonas lacus]|uniref:Uncharacterized protein n=1 Tax=Neoroseomonas lacus TaxID=287609 RepID=A0A917NPA1_9PROT|nr:hypothetical protein GCM10011320_23180 [Neoroseomonas lacus]